MPRGWLAVARREWRWMRRDRVALPLLLGVPLLAFLLLSATFGQAVIRGLRVEVVDEDRSASSMTIVQAIAAAPGVSLAGRPDHLAAAMHGIRAGRSIATVFIPRGFERDLMAARRPQLVVLYNRQFFTAGNLASGGLQAAVAAAVADLPSAPAASAVPAPGPLVVESHVLGNPALNYAQFLLRALLPTVLHVVVALSAGYAVGSEFGGRDGPGWLDTAGGSPLAALLGKLLPLFGCLVLLMVVGAGIIHGVFRVPFRGDPLVAGAAACAFIAAYLALGAALQLLVRDLSLGLSLAGIVCSPAFGFAGIGFPVMGMGDFARGWGAMLPLRWYGEILFDQAMRGVPAADSAMPLLAILALGSLFAVVAWVALRLRPMVPVATPRMADEATPRGPFRACVAEYRLVLRDRGAFGLIVLGPLLYGVLYPQPYLRQLVRDIPVAVVDQDRTALSHAIVEAVEAHEALRIAARPAGLAEAQRALARRDVFGVLTIPPGTERELLKGNRAPVVGHADATYLLLYSRMSQGFQDAVASVATEEAGRGARPGGSLQQAALARGAPAEILAEPLFNPTGGYGSYVVPAAFVLILQQTLLIGVASLRGASPGAAPQGLAARAGLVLGRSLAHGALWLPATALYLLVLPRLYGFPAGGGIGTLLALAIPFVLAVSGLAQFAGGLTRRRETAVLLMMALSLPLFFLVGVAWPLEAIPDWLRWVSYAVPGTFAIDALVRANQMGAGLGDLIADCRALWLLAVLYAALAIVAPALRPRGVRHGA
ncbi:ABC transporter permease [Falsiroseomonas ponticola]|uniref:ABC transporter permease n=1 Tax=Falsiroseomonas ponticola TaxID=2786951 RepID=UPI0019337505|nr:ABC transporter permease [Roseomonas ponticola]